MPPDLARRREIVTRWKDLYDTLLFPQHQAIYAELWDTGPRLQEHFDANALSAWMWPRDNPASVMEIGGRDGRLAKQMLDRWPREQIASWVNYEVCRDATERSRELVASPRYTALCDTWAWEYDLMPYDLLVASHSLEHMNTKHLARLLRALEHGEVGHAFVQVPNCMAPGVASTHILGLSVDELVSQFGEWGWGVVARRPGPGVTGPDTVLLLEREV